MCITPENELLQQCVASGQVEASQLVQHADAGEYPVERITPPIAVYYDVVKDLFIDAADDCAMDNDFQMSWRDRKALFPRDREAALEAAVLRMHEEK